MHTLNNENNQPKQNKMALMHALIPDQLLSHSKERCSSEQNLFDTVLSVVLLTLFPLFSLDITICLTEKNMEPFYATISRQLTHDLFRRPSKARVIFLEAPS